LPAGAKFARRADRSGLVGVEQATRHTPAH
jgi:hypothetical protein